MNPRRQNQRIAALRRGLCLLLAVALIWGGFPPQTGRAAGRSNVSLMAAPEVIMADGKSQTTITATVRGGDGQLAPNGSTVRFTTSLGTLDKDTVTMESGVARVVLTSASSAGTATVTATSFLTSGDGSSTGSASVEFTSDRDAVYTSGDARWIQIDCPQELLYSADTKVAEAHSRKGLAHLHFRGLDVMADALQVGLQSQLMLARNVTLRRGSHTLHAVELRYNLADSTGSAVVAGTGRRAFESVAIFGPLLRTSPLDANAAQAAVEDNIYRFDDLSDSHVIVMARAIAANPGTEVQFRRAGIYSDGKKILSVPFHVMSMNTSELFGQQLFGFGSQGFFVNVPFYYHVSPHSTGTLYLRNSAVQGADLGATALQSSFGQGGTRPGLAVDLQQTYSFGRGGAGSLIVDGITRSDWGAHWNHTQRIDDTTNSYFYVDYPAHRSLFATSNVSRQFKEFSLNLAASGSRNPGFDGYSSSNETLSAYVQTNAHQIGQSGINMVTNFSVQRGQLVESSPGQAKQVIPVSTRGIDFRFYTAPMRPDRHTNVTDSVDVGQSWNDHGQNSLTMLGTLGLTRTTFGHGNLSLNYTYRYDPLLSQLSSSSGANDPFGSLYRSKVQQRLSVGYTATLRPRLSVSLFGGYGLPLRDSNLFSTISYRINDNWGLGLNSFYDRYATASYHETELSVTRRLFGRDLVFVYSTKTKKVRFDLAASGL